MFTYGSNLSSNSLDYIFNPQNQPGFSAGFFPTPQRTVIESNQVQPAGADGMTYRQTAPDAPSVFETMKMAAQQWLNSPFEEQYSIPAKRIESRNLEEVISKPQADPFKETLDWALNTTKSIGTLWSEIKTQFDKPREVVEGIPRAGYPEGRDEIHYNDTGSRAATTAQQLLTMGGQFYDQVKGLFSKGYDQYMAQGVTEVKSEVQAQGTKIGVIVVIGIILYLVTK